MIKMENLLISFFKWRVFLSDAIVITNSMTREVWIAENPQFEGALNDIAETQDPVYNRKFLFYNRLSEHWSCAQFQENPVPYPFLYLFGMVGYVFALAIRTVIFVFACLKWIVGWVRALCCNHNDFCESIHEHNLVFLGALGELCSGIIGIGCPPLAYKCDEMIQKNRIIHQWYKRYYLSLWSDETERRLTKASEKKAAVNHDIHYFRDAKKQLSSEYLSEDEVDSLTPASMELIIHFCFLRHFSNYCESPFCLHNPVSFATLEETPLLPFCLHALVEIMDDSLRSKNADELLGFLENFRKGWQAARPKRYPHLLKGIEAVLILNHRHLRYHTQNTEENLLKLIGSFELNAVNFGDQVITERELIEKMANAVQKFSGMIKNTDRMMEGIVLEEAYNS